MKSDVYALRTDQTVLDALQMFGERSIPGAPTLHEDDSLSGFVSVGDVMRYRSVTHPVLHIDLFLRGRRREQPRTGDGRPGGPQRHAARYT